MSHYFTNNPNQKSNIQTFDFNYNGKVYRFSSADGVFSKGKIDFGSKTLIDAISLKNDKLNLLDLGCGYGVIGIILKDKYPNINLTQTDVNLRALELAKINAETNYISSKIFYSNGFEQIDDLFDVIILNPPIRSGKENVFKLYNGAYEHLKKGGEFYIVIQKKQGAPSHQKYLQELFENVAVICKNKGYFVFKMQKK
ncbi:MAG: class I SAM-dependent methyltransferase [Acholeplasmatales bacterium]